MRKLTRSEYFRLNVVQKMLYNVLLFLYAILTTIARIAVAAWNGVKGIGKKLKDEIMDTLATFKNGSWQTRVSYLIMGFGSITRGQVFRGVLFLIFEVAFVGYMIFKGAFWLDKFRTLGDVTGRYEEDPIYGEEVWIPGDNSFNILLYGLLTLLLCVLFLFIWRMNVKQNKMIEESLAKGKKLPTAKQDIRNLMDHQFHKTLLSLPLTGIICFTILPILFMILVAFTGYDGNHNGTNNFFSWVGLQNFRNLFGGGGSSNLSYAFGKILGWTLVWAFFATFTNYFLGMFVAILINKKGIKFKKMWRGILVLTIAIPQFVSLLYVSRLFARDGLVNGFLLKWDLVSQPVEFWANPDYARILVILINIWIGIPYLMLIATGILMNIPADLYESSKIDGANGFQQFTRITMPYMLFITGPYLLTSFIGNINNFNVIYLLTNGQTMGNPKLLTNGVATTDVDLLITWIFNITNGANHDYKLTAVIAIMIFAVVATLSLVVYNVLPSTKNEEDFQ